MSAAFAIPGESGNWRRYTEIVESTPGRGRYTILLREDPLYQQGIGAIRHKRRFAHLVDAPNLPLYQGGLGQAGPAIVSTAGGAAAAIVPSALTSTGVIAAGSLAVPLIGVGIALVTSLIAGFWSAHEARAKGATTENAAVSSAVQAFDSTMKAIFAAANSSNVQQNISAAQAVTLCQQAYTKFWQGVCSFTQGPGRADTSSCGANCGGPTNFAAPCAGMPGGHKCDSSCTVSCCVGCQDIKPAVDQAVALFQSGQGGTITVCAVASSKYGLGARGAYSLTWTPPTLPSPVASASSAVSSVASGIESLFGASPSPAGASSSPNLLLLGALALGAFLVLR